MLHSIVQHEAVVGSDESRTGPTRVSGLYFSSGRPSRAMRALESIEGEIGDSIGEFSRN
jgi:hypothetical protein